MRRAVAALLAFVLIALGVGWVQPRATVEAQEQATPPVPTVRPLIACGPRRESATFDVVGSGFPPASTVAVAFSTTASIVSTGVDIASLVGDGSLGLVAQGGGTRVQVAVDGLGTFRATFQDVYFDRAPHRVTATVVGAKIAARAIIPECPLVEATPTCSGGSATSIAVEVYGAIPDRDASVYLRVPSQSIIDSWTVSIDSRGRSSLQIPLAGIPPGVYLVRVEDAFERTDGVRVDTRCPTPSVAIDPVCVASGSPPARLALHVTGSGYHPELRLEIVFDPGRSYERWIVAADGRGNVDTWIYPYQRDPGSYGIRVRSPVDFGGDDDPPVRVARTNLTVPCVVPTEPPLVTPRPRRTPGPRVTPPPTPPPTPVPTPRPEATLSVAPRCVRPALQGDDLRRISFRVQATGFDPGTVRIVFDPPGDAPVRSVTRNADARGRIDLRIRVPAPPAGTTRVVISQQVAEPGTGARVRISARAQVSAPCRDRKPPPLVVRPTCGVPAADVADAYELSLVGRGFYPDSQATVTYGQGALAETFTAVADPKGRVETTIVVDGRKVEEVPIVMEQLDSLGRLVARAATVLTVPCPIDPSITVEPEQGPTGYTVLVRGDDFHPGSTVTLRWDRGIEGGREHTVGVAADGTFEVYLLILPNDLAGKRTLLAGLPGEPDAFPDVADEYLVVPGAGRPSGGSGHSIIDRR